MNRVLTLLLFLFISIASFGQQQKLSTSGYPEHYIDIELHSKAEVNVLAARFSIDKVHFNKETNTYEVRLWLSQREYHSFEELNIPYSIVQQDKSKAAAGMANSYEELVQAWDKYPTYQAYLETMYYFQSQYPDICKIDTILANTVSGHQILVAHISNTLNDSVDNPSFFYTSTIHGDEVTGYYLMLRLIHYILHNQDEPKVAEILNGVDLWICPLENPDGTYHTGNHIIGTSPISTRANANGFDLNRNYPLINGSSTSPYQPEIQAMMNFMEKKNFVMSANLHGGAELFNYPWDSYTSYQKLHPDTPWWITVGRAFADTCHRKKSTYFMEQDRGVTHGGDWYVITGSRQDYANYFLHCREITIEISIDKVLSNEQLNNYWQYSNSSLFNLIQQVQYGLRGKVVDSFSQEPLHAKIVIEQHDDLSQHSEVYTRSSSGNYYRPILPGSYNVTVSAEGYIPQTHTVNVSTDKSYISNIALSKILDVEDYITPKYKLYPNPANSHLTLTLASAPAEYEWVEILDLYGRCLQTFSVTTQTTTFSVTHLSPGYYLLRTPYGNEKFIIIKK